MENNKTNKRRNSKAFESYEVNIKSELINNKEIEEVFDDDPIIVENDSDKSDKWPDWVEPFEKSQGF